jgi:8-oxo-dGTP pyrophosphatase MutT (NUDIX family)
MDTTEPQAAVAIVRAGRPRKSFLLIRRSERPEDSWSGHWSFPGGRRDADDVDLLHTALRELEEECGIRLGREHMAKALPHVVARRRAGPFVLVAPFVFEVDGELPTVVDREEAVDAVWIPQSVWCDPAKHSLRAVPGLPGNWLFPAVDLNGVPVWGFTYRLATDWLGLLPEQGPTGEAGFETACRVLDFLLSQGLTLTSGWEDQPAQLDTAERQGARVATVEGAISVEQVVARFSTPGKLFPGVNLLEIRPDGIRVVGLAFEEYLISASAGESVAPTA